MSKKYWLNNEFGALWVIEKDTDSVEGKRVLEECLFELAIYAHFSKWMDLHTSPRAWTEQAINTNQKSEYQILD